MSARPGVAREQSAALDDEIAWQRSYNKTDEQIARDLRVSLDLIQQRARRRRVTA